MSAFTDARISCLEEEAARMRAVLDRIEAICDAQGDYVMVYALRAVMANPATCARSHCDRDVDPTIDPDLCPPCHEQADNLNNGVN